MLIQLTQGKFAIIDDEDWDKELTTTVCGEGVTTRICDRKWFAVRTKRSIFYAAGAVLVKKNLKRQLLIHRLILGIPPSPKFEVDHINQNGLDNRKSNLRWVTTSQNVLNGRIQNSHSSKYIGVSWHKREKKWYARIGFNGKVIHIGCFNNEEDAAVAYDRKK